MLGATLPQFVAWVGGTAIGAVGGAAIGSAEDLGLDAIFPAFFLKLLAAERVALASAGIKAVGPAFVGRRDLPEGAVGVIAPLAPALLALVVTSTLSARTLALDARAVGVCVAALELALRAPVLVVVLLAAVSTSLVRALS